MAIFTEIFGIAHIAGSSLPFFQQSERPSDEADGFRIQEFKGSSEKLLPITLESWNPRPLEPLWRIRSN